MSIETVRSFFLWCSVINYGFLLLWAVVIRFWREGAYRLWGRLFPLPQPQFDALTLAGMTLYKLGILLFNIVPCIALYLVK
jgi:hypothetical protein